MRKRRHNASILLEALLQGQTFEHNGETWALSDDLNLCVKREKYQLGDNGENVSLGEVYLKADFSLQGFLKMAEEVDEDTVTIIGMNAALTSLRRDNIRY